MAWSGQRIKQADCSCTGYEPGSHNNHVQNISGRKAKVNIFIKG